MELEPIHGRMEDNTQVNGKMENSMEKVFIAKVLAKREEVYGKMEKELDGLMKNDQENIHLINADFIITYSLFNH